MTDWQHKQECTEHECYCAGLERSDPICDCGCPAWACNCEDDYAEKFVQEMPEM
jgi:hypothetical protein